MQSYVGFCRAIAQAVKSCAPRKPPQQLFEDYTLLSGRTAFKMFILSVFTLFMLFLSTVGCACIQWKIVSGSWRENSSGCVEVR